MDWDKFEAEYKAALAKRDEQLERRFAGIERRLAMVPWAWALMGLILGAALFGAGLWVGSH